MRPLDTVALVAFGVGWFWVGATIQRLWGAA